MSDNPECVACGLTAADLPDEMTADEFVVADVLFPTGDDGQTYCQGCIR